MTTCSVKGCHTPTTGRGLCHKHYFRWRKYGDPLKVLRIRGEPPVTRKCAFCGKSVTRPASVFRKRDAAGVKQTFCNNQCRIKGTTPDEIERFWSKVKKTRGCWVWEAATDGDGYGIFAVTRDGKHFNVRAHRYAYELQVKPIPEGLDVLHECDNPPCVRGKHLWTGTCKDNQADMAVKGRHGNRPAKPGEGNIRAKLTEAQVREIRRTNPSRVLAAKKYNVSTATIWSVVTRKTWRHVK